MPRARPASASISGGDPEQPADRGLQKPDGPVRIDRTGSDLVPAGVHQREVGGQQPVRGEVAAERTRRLAAADQREHRLVQRLVGADQRARAEPGADHVGQALVAILLSPGHCDQSIERRGRVLPGEVDRLQRRAEPSHRPLGERLQERLAGGKVRVHGHPRDAGLGGHRGDAGGGAAFEQRLGGVEDRLHVALGGRPPVVRAGFGHLPHHRTGAAGASTRASIRASIRASMSAHPRPRERPDHRDDGRRRQRQRAGDHSRGHERAAREPGRARADRDRRQHRRAERGADLVRG